MQWTTIDAAGRMIAVRDRWRLAAAASQEDETGYVHDGDGRPVIEKVGFRVLTTPNPDPMVVNVTKYQVWSSVLGTSLTTVTPQGAKDETKVFAGGTHIATQAGGVMFVTADPVTGTVGSFSGSSSTGVIEQEAGIVLSCPEVIFDTRDSLLRSKSQREIFEKDLFVSYGDGCLAVEKGELLSFSTQLNN